MEDRVQTKQVDGSPTKGRRRITAAFVFASLLVACSGPEGKAPAVERRELAHRSGAGQAVLETEQTLFEAASVRPVAVGPDGYVAVTNTPDNSIEIFRPTHHGAEGCGSVKVGMRPVAAAWVGDDVWVVNHLSDSISVVELERRRCRGFVSRTLQVGDEPRDIVVAKNRRGKDYVFVTTAHRGQNVVNADGSPRDPELTRPGVGRADVFVFDPDRLGVRGREAPLEIFNFFTDTPRALAVGDHKVYVAGFFSGNQTAVVRYQLVIDRGRRSYRELDADGDFEIDDAETAFIEGGYPAVRGHGRCVSTQSIVAPLSTNDFIMDVCVETDPDDSYRPIAIHPQTPGVVTDTCSCTNAIGELQRTPPLIVRFFDEAAICGDDYSSELGGCWLEPPERDDLAGLRSAQQWNAAVPFALPDKDVFTIDLADRPVISSEVYRHVGTTIFGMAVHPQSGKIFAGNLEARNHVRFEGPGEGEGQDAAHGNTTVRGHIAESRITVIDTALAQVQPVHLNEHIDYSKCCAPAPNAETERSLAFPVQVAITDQRDRKGRPRARQNLYVAALGSDKVAVIPTNRLENAEEGALVQDESMHIDVTGGPTGLAIDERRDRLYVLARFSNDLVVIDTESREILGREHLENPEPKSVIEGRRFLYDARLSSSHGDSACFSCHIFGDLDGLAWDLGDPNSVEVQNLGPFFSKPEILSPPLTSHFLALKGPMTTQSFRGMANHGAMHWRGDRRSAEPESSQPDSGAFDEVAAFQAFNVAFPGLTGRSELLSDEDMTKFTNFVLQLTYPPNPIRALDDSLDEQQKVARNIYFGCDVTDESMERGECVDGRNIEAETLACNCANPPRFLLGLEARPDYCPPDPQCTLALSDFQNTCHGCHALDPDANAEFGVAKPGFFGSNGLYTNDAVAHILKIPHLRNAYQKVGMFGSYKTPDGIGLTSIADSVLGARRGGLLATQNQHVGDQIRGFGFTHAGEEDTMFHFFSLTGFVRSPSPSEFFPNDNAAGFEPVLPVDPAACFDAQLPSLNEAFLAQLASPSELGQLGVWLGALSDPNSSPEARAAAGLGLATFIAGLPPENPGSVFQLLPLEAAVGQLALPLLACGNVPDSATLTTLGCFDLETGAGCQEWIDLVRGCSLWGATLEELLPNGTQACIASGILEKSAMESFVFAFDNNVKPIVGQQVTITRASRPASQERLDLLLDRADVGDCDLVAVGPKGTYLYEEGRWMRRGRKSSNLSRVLEQERVLTFTALAPGEGPRQLRRYADNHD